MSRPLLRQLVMTGGILCALMMASPSPRLRAQAEAAAAPNLARDPDVLGAQRLFSAWLEGQMLYRHLPGIAVGVVADQELVWAAGFGFADADKKAPMTPQTRFRMASHSKLFTATAVMQLRAALEKALKPLLDEQAEPAGLEPRGRARARLGQLIGSVSFELTAGDRR